MSTAAAVRDLSDSDLFALYATDPAAALAEGKRRDAADYARAHRAAIRSEWAEGAFALYLQAEAETRGHMLSRRGIAEGIDPWTLFSGPERRVYCYGSEELQEFFWNHPRVTLAEYTRQRPASLKAQHDEHLESKTAECDTMSEEISDDGLADDGRADVECAAAAGSVPARDGHRGNRRPEALEGQMDLFGEE